MPRWIYAWTAACFTKHRKMQQGTPRWISPSDAVAVNFAQLVDRPSQSRFSRRKMSNDVPQYMREFAMTKELLRTELRTSMVWWERKKMQNDWNNTQQPGKSWDELINKGVHSQAFGQRLGANWWISPSQTELECHHPFSFQKKTSS